MKASTARMSRYVARVFLASSGKRTVQEMSQLLTSALKRHIYYSKESRLAGQGGMTYAAAIERTFSRREAFALARPHSALMLGYGTSSFTYLEGVLCYCQGATIRILQVHEASNVERTIDLSSVLRQIWGCEVGFPNARAELLHCQDGMLSFSTTAPRHELLPQAGQEWVVTVDIRHDVPITRRIKLAINCDRTRIWIRNDSRYLFIGAHDGLGSHGHHEWVLQRYDLADGAKSLEMQLPYLCGADVGQTVVFQIYDGYLYALSNQSKFEVEEIDWTSYYQCYRFPVDGSSRVLLEATRLWRRQHREGPINDLWTDLALYKDESSGDVFIIESRREWKNGISAQRRTYYRQKLTFPHRPSCVPDDATIMESPRVSLADPHSELWITALPLGDPLIGLLDENSRPLYEEAHPRPDRDCHHEHSVLEGGESAPHYFTLTKTKYRVYNPSCSAFLDLVWDHSVYPQSQGTVQQMRLRIGSRKQAPPLDKKGILYKPTVNETDRTSIKDSEERFSDQGIRMWPPNDAPLRLLKLLNPCSRNQAHVGCCSSIRGRVAAISDERSIVFMAGECSLKGQSIVLINFDSWSRFEGLESLKGKYEYLISRERPTETITTLEGQHASSDWVSTHSGSRNDTGSEQERDDCRSWFREERAMHVDISQGFQFF